jgi:methyl-accepting chemotaxis protein
MGERAQAEAREIAELTERALESGALTEAELFDHDYKEIAGSDPKRFANRLMPWIDGNWRPVCDRISTSDRQITATAA